MTRDNVYRDHARAVLRRCEGDYTAARLSLARDRDNSSGGTFSHAFNNAALKELEALKRDQEPNE